MIRRFASLSLPCLLVAGCGPDGEPERASEPVSWNLDVRPVLAAKCLRCHGANEPLNVSGLRLDRPESFLVALEESAGPAVVPGDRAASAVWARLHADDPDERMPPPESGPTLTAAEKELIGRWIDQGAPVDPHWAFESLPPEVAVPETDSAWPRSQVDRFVLRGMERAGGSPAPDADPPAWLRRVSIDLTGLPPTSDALAGFESALQAGGDEEAARAAVVDRLLASPGYGERMAEWWLTIIGYADTWEFGDEAPRNTQWPYRDWVVQAFRANVPYHQFLEQQLAGDLFDEPTAPEVLATAMLRSHSLPDRVTGEPRADRRAEAAAHRVHMIGSALLGLSLDCARCHAHPLDPLTPREFRRLAAFLPARDESGWTGGPGVVPAPTLLWPEADQAAQLAAERESVVALERRLAALSGEREAAFREWLAQDGKLPVMADGTGLFTFDDRREHLANRALGATSAGTAADVAFTDGVHGSAARFDGRGAVHFPDLAPPDRAAPWTIALWIRDHEARPGPATVAEAGDGTRGLQLRLATGHLAARFVREWPGHALAVRSTTPLVRKGEWTHVAWTYDGSGQAAGLQLFANGRPVETTIVADRLRKGAVPPDAGGWELGAGLGHADVDDVQLFARDLTPLEIAHLHDGTTLATAAANADEQVEALRTYFLSSIDPEARRLRAKLTAARRRLLESASRIPEVAIMEGGPPPVGETSRPGVPDILPPLEPQASPPTRLELAGWLTAPDHPLTARVFVNRLWAHFFGEGIVATPDDFGIGGAAPHDPKLLDWLARDFVNSGWDIRHVCRHIVLSAAYRQAASGPDDAGPPAGRVVTRPLMPAERRDVVLAAAGLLDTTGGGPPVEANPAAPGRHRRSLYGAWERNAPRLAVVATGADDGACPVERTAIDTPPQSLVRLNDLHVLEASRALAREVLTLATDDDESRLRHVFTRLASRPPTDEELATLQLELAGQRERFDDASGDGPQLVRPGTEDPPGGADPQELAAWMAVVESLLAHEAVTWRR